MRLLLTISVVLFLHCSDRESNQPGGKLIQNQIFTSTLSLTGSEWDGTVIKNCTFQDIISPDGIHAMSGIEISGASNVLIDSCLFLNIQGNGIRLRRSGGVTTGIVVQNCRFDSIYANGIQITEDNQNVSILNNQIQNLGLDTTSAALGAPHHGIYAMARGVLIEHNTISGVYNPRGNCISIRSGGVIRNNRLFASTKFGINYFSDHPGAGETLLIERNTIYGNPKGGIGFNSNGNGNNHIKSAIVQFNDITQKIGPCIYVAENIRGVKFEINDNSCIDNSAGYDTDAY